MPKLSIDHDEPALFIFFEDDEQITDEMNAQIEHCRLHHNLIGGWADGTNTLIFQGHSSALECAEKELNALNFSAHITTHNALHSDMPDEAYADDGCDELDFDPVNDRILAIYPFPPQQLCQAQNSAHTLGAVEAFMKAAIKVQNLDLTFENKMNAYEKDHAAEFIDGPDSRMVYMIGSLDDMVLAKEYFKNDYACVIMTEEQFSDNIDPSEVSRKDDAHKPHYH